MKPTLLAVLVLSLLTVATPRVATQTLLAQSIANGQSSCRSGDRGRLLDAERVASHPTAASVRDYFDEWVAFYQDFYQFPRTSPWYSPTASTATRSRTARWTRSCRVSGWRDR